VALSRRTVHDTAADTPHPHEHRHPSENILVAFNNPSAVRVYRINKDFTPGDEVKQPGPIDAASTLIRCA